MPDFAWKSEIIWLVVKNLLNYAKSNKNLGENSLELNVIQPTITLEPLRLSLEERVQK